MGRRPSTPRVWQRMLSGRRLDLLDPRPADIAIGDIAHGLARVARWNGQTRGPHPLSVAQHSVLVERIAGLLEPAAEPPVLLAVLLHDAAEYVIGDIISPFKAVLGDGYREVEGRILHAVMARFGLSAGVQRRAKRLAKRADIVAAYHEATLLAGFGRAEAVRYFGRPAPLPAALLPLLDPWTTAEAEAAFLGRFHTLAGPPEAGDS